MIGARTERQGPVAWMAGHPVAANLLMLALVIGGLVMAFRVKQEVFPEFTLDIVGVSVTYPGASPEEVEKGIVLRAIAKLRADFHLVRLDVEAIEPCIAR